MKHRLTRIICLLILLSIVMPSAFTRPASAKTTVVLLGTGTPNPDPDHSGGSVAIIVDKTPYIIDFGPGLIRNAARLSPRYGGTIESLAGECTRDHRRHRL